MVTVDPEEYPSTVPSEPTYPLGKRKLHEYLRHYADKHPEKPAINYYGYEVTYAELDRQSDQLASYLAEKGYGTDDTLLVYLQNSPQIFVGYYAAQKIGMKVDPCSPLAGEHRLEYQLNDTNAEAVFALDTFADDLESVQRETPLTDIIYTRYEEYLRDDPYPAIHQDMQEALASNKLDTGPNEEYFSTIKETCSANPPRPNLPMEHVVYLPYTGGTTGLPKGCAHTYSTILDAAASVASAISFDSDDRPIGFMPLFHIAGMTQLVNVATLHGATAILLFRYDPESVMQAIERYLPTKSNMPVQTVTGILDHLKRDEYDLGSLDVTPATSYSQSLTEDIIDRWQAVTGAEIFEGGYGLTESHNGITVSYGIDIVEEGFVGMPGYGVDIVIRDWETHEPLETGETGEISIKCPSLMKEYWNKPEENDSAFYEGYLLTGDIGRLTEEKHLYYLGRRKNMIKNHGFSVAPLEVEWVLEAHEDIENSVVVGRDKEDEHDDDVIAVVTLSDSSLTREEIVEWCEAKLAFYEVPEEIIVVDEMPTTDVGKADRKVVQERVNDDYDWT